MVRYIRFPFQDADKISKDWENATLRGGQIGTKAGEFEFDGPQFGRKVVR